MGTSNLDSREAIVEDRISSLQDDLLCRILSLLPTKDTVATSVLSTRWKNLYASVTDLYFKHSPSGTTTNKDFIAFVTNVISAVLTKSKYIRKLKFYCHYGPRCSCTTSLVASWIAAASGPNLQDLNIRTQYLINPVPLPPQLFHCKALTSMEIRGPFSLCVPEQVVFPSLRSLTMCSLILPDDVSLRRLFSGCVVLEKLGLERCVLNLISVLEVSIASLKHLSFENIDGDYKLFLNTPNLESFNFDGCANRGYFGDTLTSLIRAKVFIRDGGHFAYEEASQLMNLVSNANSLSIAHFSMKSLTYNQAILFQRLTKLTLNPGTVKGWCSLPILLTNSPCLKVLDLVSGLRGDFDEDLAVMESFLLEPVPICVSAHLKEVIFGRFYGEELEFKAVEYFLKNAEVLEMMSISATPSWVPELDDYVAPSIEDQFRMTKRLLGLPRWSKTCRIVFGCTHY